MNQPEGDKILQAVRQSYATGHKSSNKLYNISKSDQTKLYTRDENRTIADILIKAMRAGTIPKDTKAGNCEEMAREAQRLTTQAGHTALIGNVTKPGDHAFCVVDYTPGNNPAHVNDMINTNAPNAWIIDPWMNISCKFTDYPAMAEQKLAKWANDGKDIIFFDKQTNPQSANYLNGFFTTGPLSFTP
jgi:hypothetical protein